MDRTRACTGVVMLAVVIVCAGLHPRTGAQADPWTKDMAAFEQQDRTSPFAPGGIVFVGSSSIRLWDLKASFPDTPILNRGFGGSHIADSVRHVELLVLKHKPRTVVLYAGDNDIAEGKTPETVLDDFKALVGKIHGSLPRTRVAFIGIKPSIQRWALVAKVREANRLVRAYCESDERLGFVDVDGPMLGWDERPRKELLVSDGLHLSPRGYELWTMLVRPFLE